jgi:hypothetical protein
LNGEIHFGWSRNFFMSISVTDTKRDPDEQVDIKSLIAEVVRDSERWMDTPHELLGGYKPRDLIGNPHEGELRALVRSIKIGMFS